MAAPLVRRARRPADARLFFGCAAALALSGAPFAGCSSANLEKESCTTICDHRRRCIDPSIVADPCIEACIQWVFTGPGAAGAAGDAGSAGTGGLAGGGGGGGAGDAGGGSGNAGNAGAVGGASGGAGVSGGAGASGSAGASGGAGGAARSNAIAAGGAALAGAVRGDTGNSDQAAGSPSAGPFGIGTERGRLLQARRCAACVEDRLCSTASELCGDECLGIPGE